MEEKTQNPSLILSKEALSSLLELTTDLISKVAKESENVPIAPLPPLTEVKAALAPFDFKKALSPKALLEWTLHQLNTLDFHFDDPHYFGVFNPAPSAMGIVGDLLASTFNSQLASAISSPFGVIVEEHLIDFFLTQFGMKTTSSGGTFTGGGTEANFTAVLCALNHTFPELEKKGLVGLPARPRLYVSTETHHSFLKAAKMAGIGLDSVVEIPVSEGLTLDPEILREKIKRDRALELKPFLIVGTFGSTSAGVIDPLSELQAIARDENCWFHVDAAWGGAACLLPEMKPLLAPVREADSLCLDAHKWLNVPMTAGLFLCKEGNLLNQAFRVEPSPYMPKDTDDVVPPYHRSLQWSRRFTGLKLFLSLASVGIEGYRAALRHQIAMGDLLRKLLLEAGWRLENKTPLPVVCFSRGKNFDAFAIAKLIAASGKAWITTTELTHEKRTVLRAGISNALTEPKHLVALVQLLESAWQTHSEANS